MISFTSFENTKRGCSLDTCGRGEDAGSRDWLVGGEEKGVAVLDRRGAWQVWSVENINKLKLG